jgi:hypothetical protein
MRNSAIGVAILSILPLLAEGSEVMHVKWEDLPMVQDKTIRISLPGGFISGKADSVEADALVVEVEQLHRLEMRTKGKTGRIVLTSLGTVMGLAGGVATAAFGLEGCHIFTCRNDRLAAAGVESIGVAAAGVAGGYFAGNALDKRWTAIEIVP